VASPGFERLALDGEALTGGSRLAIKARCYTRNGDNGFDPGVRLPLVD
jgi:hypothetical protein